MLEKEIKILEINKEEIVILRIATKVIKDTWSLLRWPTLAPQATKTKENSDIWDRYKPAKNPDRLR